MVVCQLLLHSGFCLPAMVMKTDNNGNNEYCSKTNIDDATILYTHNATLKSTKGQHAPYIALYHINKMCVLFCFPSVCVCWADASAASF
jgi:hypothetical protein